MQLTNQRLRNVRGTLTLATSALLGMAGAAQAADNGWLVDTALLGYSESDSRVTAAEPVISLKKDMGGERVLNIKLVADALTGASPNGAVAANKAQTFTSPSGSSPYTAQAGETPLDDSFKDTRGSLSVGWQQPWRDVYRLSVGGNLSAEYDFASAGLNAALARELNDKNTTLSAGLNLEFDGIKPVGGAPDPFSTPTQQHKGGSDSKLVADVLLGLTQVINRHVLMQFNYSLSQASGYQTDPYKILTVLNGGNLVDDPTDSNPSGPYLYLYENRPDTRTKHSLFWQTKIALTDDVVDLSYRFMTDDWGVQSHTLDAKYRWQAGGGFYLEPHLRWYTQTEADFYRSFLQQGSEVSISGSTVTSQLAEASADPRLAAFDAVTYGLKLGYQWGRDQELNVRVEQYQQTGKGDSPTLPAGSDVAGQTLFPELSATWVQIGYAFRW